MAQIGLVKILHYGSWCCRTHLISESCISGNTAEYSRNQFLNIEVNNRIYGYTEDLLKIFLLSTLTENEVYFKNLFVGSITQEMCKKLESQGIVSSTVLAFFREHVKPSPFCKSIQYLPETVSEQIQSWAKSRYFSYE